VTLVAQDAYGFDGTVELSAGSSSDDIRSIATLTVTGETRTITGEERAFLSATIVGPR
jgi:hypothetical protein